MYIVNIAVRVLVLTFVFVGGAITFAGPQVHSIPAKSNKAAEMPVATSQDASATERASGKTAARDLG